MTAKSVVRALLKKMPDDVSLADIIRCVDVLDLAGVDSSAELSRELNQDLAAFFSKKNRPSNASIRNDAKKRVLHVLSILREDATLGVILNRLTLVQRIELGLEESERGEVLDHDEFCKQLDDEGFTTAASKS